MHYPVWYVPQLTAPMLIAVIAVLHVLVSHYAVGGGFFLAVETGYAYRTNNSAYLEYLRRHAWFFILITVVYGAVTGVGIWWTIGLSSPLATEMLIHTFVFGWAMEYVTFILEIASAFAFFYYWGRLEARTHLIIAWIYAIAAWLSLVLITGITSFMLNPGLWPRTQNFWLGILNPQFVPQTLTRTGGSFLLASLYVYLHASIKMQDPQLRELVASRSARPALLGAVLVAVGGAGWFAFLPDSARAALLAAPVLNVFMALVVAFTAAVFVMIYFGPYKNPAWLSPALAVLLLASGMGAATAGEYLREAIRKPYIIYNVVMSNQIRADELPSYQSQGALEAGRWTKAYVAQKYPQVIRNQKVDTSRLLSLPEADQVELGHVLFQYQCANCHATTIGYNPVAQYIRGWSEDMLRDLALHPERVRFVMPPWAGTREEAELLVKYLKSIQPPYPRGMHGGTR
jgi:cytochrome d ubiquinol oxidase subunit I